MEYAEANKQSRCVYIYKHSKIPIFFPGEEEGPCIMDRGAAQIDTPHVPEQEFPESGHELKLTGKVLQSEGFE